MKDLYASTRELYEAAFPNEPTAFTDALFAACFPKYLRLIGKGPTAVSMLFSIPYAIQTGNSTVDARYLYGIATHPDHRGQGYAKRLINAEMSRGKPLFLRPMSPSLFDFYKKTGLSPFSPISEECGTATGDIAYTALTPSAYGIRRYRFLTPPFCAPTDDFLALACLDGGAVAVGDDVLTLFERHGDMIFFKEWFGDLQMAPALSASLGGKSYRLRTYDQKGSHFGVGYGLPGDSAFLLALD